MEELVLGKQIYKLIPKIMSEVGSISKDRRGDGIRYLFRGIDDAYLAFQGPLSKNGVFFTPCVLENVREERQTKTGSTMIIAIVKVEYQFYAPDGSSVSAVVVGEAMDTSDKATNKAFSAALKLALFQVFCIPTEEKKDTEEDDHALPPLPTGNTKGYDAKAKKDLDAKISEKQIKFMMAKAYESNWSNDEIKKYWEELGISKAEDINRTQLDYFLELVKKFPKEKK